jgi:hypothetical protein
MKKLGYTLLALTLTVCAACVASRLDVDVDVRNEAPRSQQEEAVPQGPALLAVPPVLSL